MIVAGCLGLALASVGGCTPRFQSADAPAAPDVAPAPLTAAELLASPPAEETSEQQPAPPMSTLVIIGVNEKVEHAIRNATRVAGVDTAYLVVVAARESNFDPSRHARHTSAAGLYQFTAGTWLRSVRAFGEGNGLDEYARQIVVGRYGGVFMRNGTARARLLRLRSDPELSALMAAELARDNEARLEHLLGRPVAPAELYMAHLLGVAQAARFLAVARRAPHTPGARLLPAAARTNPGIFRPKGRVASADAIIGKIKGYFQHQEERYVLRIEFDRFARSAEVASMPD